MMDMDTEGPSTVHYVWIFVHYILLGIRNFITWQIDDSIFSEVITAAILNLESNICEMAKVDRVNTLTKSV